MDNTQKLNAIFGVKTQEPQRPSLDEIFGKAKPVEEKPGYFDRVKNDYKQAGMDTMNDIQSGADKLNAATDEGGIKGGIKATGALLGSALHTAGNVAGAAIAPITEAVEPLVSPIVKKIAELPGFQGGIEKATEWAQKHPEAAKSLEDVVNIGTLGLGGAVEQPVKEAIVSGAKKAATGIADTTEGLMKSGSKLKNAVKDKIIDTPETKAFKSVTPNAKDLSEGEFEDLLKKGKFKPREGMKAPEYVMSEEEKNFALKHKDILQSNDPVENSINVIQKIADEDKKVGEFLKSNNGIFNSGELKNHLRNSIDDITDITIDEGRMSKAKETLINNFVSKLKKNNMEGLWKNRKQFDKEIEKAFSGSPTLPKEMKKALRNGVQDFIAERTPEGIYKQSMKEMSQLFDMYDTIATKAAKERGRNWIQAWAKRNPNKATAAKWIIGGGTAGALVSKMF